MLYVRLFQYQCASPQSHPIRVDVPKSFVVASVDGSRICFAFHICVKVRGVELNPLDLRERAVGVVKLVVQVARGSVFTT